MTYQGYDSLELSVIRWAEDRKIIPYSNSNAQAQKTLEEAGELIEAATALQLLKKLGMPEGDTLYKFWMQKYMDAVGDIVVTLINGAALENVQVTKCLAMAYDEIKDRTGHMNADGIFVKDSK